MNKEQFLETSYKLASSLDVILALGKGETLLTVLAGMGYTKERLIEIGNFMDENTTADEFNEHVEKRAFISYVDGVEEMAKYMEIAKGYQEMGEINLAISKEDHHLEEEGEKLNEMDRENSKGGNQAG